MDVLLRAGPLRARTRAAGPGGIAALLALGLAGCGEAPPLEIGPGRFDLLARAPDEILDQPGHVLPDERTQWGDLGRHGWDTKTRQTSNGHDVRFVWSRQPVGYIDLPAGRPAARTLEVTLFGPPCEDAAGRTAVLKLNDVPIQGGEIPLPTKPETFSFEIPEAVWIRGRNRLEIAVDGLRELEEGPDQAGFALAEVSYADRHLVRSEPGARRLVLEHDTSASFNLEELASMRLELRGTARGAGELRVLCWLVDPATGNREGGEESALLFSVPAADQAIERGVVLPSAGDKFLQLELNWIGAGATFTCEQVTLVEPRPAERFPVIFISVDTLSARRLSVYGHPRPTSPNLERFASEAVVFEHCVTNAPWTLPSFMSVMSGLYPLAHRLDAPPKGWARSSLYEKWYVADNRWMLAEALRAAGYSTAGFVDNNWIVERHGFPQGFETYDHSAGDIDTTDMDGGIRRTSRLARAWLDERGPAEPFFLFLHCFDVHGPYTPPAPYAGRFRDDALFDPRAEAFAGGLPNSFGIVPTYIARGEVPSGPIPGRMKTAPIEEKYDEEVLMVDEELGKFFDYLRERGIYDRSLIVLSADHGETMDDGDYYFGHGILDEEVVHVPLMVRLPGGRNGGRRVPQTVQSADIYPTVLDEVGFGAGRSYLDGRSLKPLLDGGQLEEAPAFCEGGIMWQASLTYKGWKLVLDNPGVDSAREVLLTHRRTPREWLEQHAPAILERGLTEEVFDELIRRDDWSALQYELRDLMREQEMRLFYLPDDPDEDHDLADERADMKRALVKLMAIEKHKRDVARKNAQNPASPVHLDGSVLEELGKLGYVDTSAAEDDEDARESASPHEDVEDDPN